jgi:uncharacterized protein involved in tolerance to divalent cations
LDVLENLLPTVDNLVFKEPLNGDIDFAIMAECGFNNVTSMVFESGNITSIRNLPQQITRLHIANNLLAHLEDLPESLIDLNAAGNGLQRLDLSALPNLRTVNVSNNELVTILLSPTIETLLCENNKLVELNLDGMDALKTLNCNGNPLLSISNFQESIENFMMESNPALEIRKKMDGQSEQQSEESEKSNIEFKQAIRNYFEMKKTYEENKKEMKTRMYERERAKKTSKKQIREMLESANIACVNCDRPVNTVFTCKDRTYKAVCGDEKNPCNLRIELYAGEYKDVRNMLLFFRQAMQDGREDIIKIKMDSLLNYDTEQKSVKVFKKNIEEYNEISTYFKSLEKDYEELFFNEQTIAKIKNKSIEIFNLQETMRKMIEEYKRTDVGSQNTITDIMLLYMEELLPKYKTLDQLKYPFKEMEIAGTLNKPINVMIQKSLEFNRLDYSFGNEEPRVIAYTL